MKNIHSKVFTRAHQVKHLFSTWSDCLKTVWAIYNMEKEVEAGKKITFQFKKKDGTIRTAIAGKVPESYQFKSTTTKNPLVQKYYDLEKDAFRSFKVENFLALVEAKEVLLINLKAA